MAPELGPAQKPLRSMVVTVPEDSRESFFAQLKQFADTYSFAIRIAPITPGGEEFGVDMSREDIEMHGASVWSPEEFEFAFYRNGKLPVPRGSMDKLFEDLKQTVEQVPGVVVSDAK